MDGKLGVSKIRSREDAASLVEKHLPAGAIKALVRGGLSDAEEPLSKEESDKAVGVARIIPKAEQVFGEPERAWRWLRKPKPRFEGKTPVEMLATEAGACLVEEMTDHRQQSSHGAA